jgi:hypothetical protein
VLEDVSLLVRRAALDDAERSEDVADRLAQSRGAVDHEERRLLRAHAAVDEILE